MLKYKQGSQLKHSHFANKNYCFIYNKFKPVSASTINKYKEWSTSYQYESWYEGGSTCQGHVELGSQGVEKHAYYKEDTERIKTD